MCFGFGEAICPDCYEGEEKFLFFDNRYWLNRIMARVFNQRTPTSEPISPDPTIIHSTSETSMIEITE